MTNISVSNSLKFIHTEAYSSDQIHFWPDQTQRGLRYELTHIYEQAFPSMPDEQKNIYISDYFRVPVPNCSRQSIFYRNEHKELIATTIFVQTKVDCENRRLECIYLISRAISPKYRGFGLGKAMASKVLEDYQPDILFTTCAQSSSLHSWVKIVEKGLVQGFEAFPRLEKRNEKPFLTTIPLNDFNFILDAFKQTYLEVVEGSRSDADKALNSISPNLVRKNIYNGMYEFNPWAKNGREDELAKALGLTSKDGVLVMIHKAQVINKINKLH